MATLSFDKDLTSSSSFSMLIIISVVKRKMPKLLQVLPLILLTSQGDNLEVVRGDPGQGLER